MDRLFSKNHIWIEAEGSVARIGISDYAQTKLKAILFLNLPDAGDTLTAGKRFGDIESIKTVSDLIAPADGVVLAVNEDLLDDPSEINEAPYESWFMEIEVTALEDGLMSEETYEDFLCSTIS